MSEPFSFTDSHAPTNQEYLEVDWAMFGELCRALALKVARDYNPEVIVGIARAGVIPAAVVATILRLDFYSMRISRRQGDTTVRERPAVLSEAPLEVRGKRVLIVDEITTSGDTLRLALAAVRDVHPAEVRTATSFARSSGYRPDYSALTMDANVIFPWDRKVFDGDELVVNPRYRDVLDE
ncbi:MAG: phosphoribosyltransferase family protein [Gemmatimonadetes bacterium]|nr:phosphoribosyltransferase family protein [Gemmatimonadota bacterium]MDA1102620.1 phosphoribosyltransferase family protein [Gemmatimonadota bacterium]